jgi:hypothetical protein
MRHASIQTTMNVYGRLTLEKTLYRFPYLFSVFCRNELCDLNETLTM